jgi:hypothetical protein
MAVSNLAAAVILFMGYTAQFVSAKSVTLLGRQLLGNPQDPGQPRPFDPQPGNPLLIDPPRQLRTCHDLTLENSVLHASCRSGTDDTDVSTNLDLNQCVENQSGRLVYAAK